MIYHVWLAQQAARRASVTLLVAVIGEGEAHQDARLRAPTPRPNAWIAVAPTVQAISCQCAMRDRWSHLAAASAPFHERTQASRADARSIIAARRALHAGRSP